MASTINISLPEPLLAYVMECTQVGEYASPDEYILGLIESDQSNKKRDLAAYFEGVLRDRSRSVEISDEDWASGNVVRTLKAHAKTLR